MNIRQTSLAVAIVLALSFISVISYKLYGLYQTKKENISTQSSIEAASILNKAIIELSLERSVMQVTLNLDDPIAPQFKELLDGQRVKSDEGFKQVTELVSNDKSFRRSGEFLAALNSLQAQINNIRERADQSLKLPMERRNKSEVENLPPEMKDTILSFSKLPIKLRPENAQIPSAVATLEKIQYNAWAVREYGGRERTYFAIATATGRGFDLKTLKEMKSYHAEALTSMKQLELLSEYIGLSEDVVQNIKKVKDVYFGSYEKIRDDLLRAAELGRPYPMSFGDFFTKSTEALDTAVNLSYLAGDEMVAYMQAIDSRNAVLLWIFSGVLVFVIALCGFQIYYTQVKVSGRILTIAEYMKDLTNGNTDIDLKELQSSDEIGQMAEHVEVFRTNAIEVKRLEKEQLEQQQKAEEAKKKAAQDMANAFEERIGIIVESVEKASKEMQVMSNALSEAMSKASGQSSSVASSSQEATANVQTVATAAEEMSASILEISNNIQDTARKAKQCASSAQTSQEKLTHLQSAVEEIDSVIQTINEIAEQTNLLALNATIEAARAGEAGKGFAVVASEVKSLANETHKMTDEISKKVQDIKDSAAQTIESVNDIISQITAVDDKTTSVASAIEQQTATTNEISQSVAQAASGTGKVSQNIEDVQKVTNESAESTEKLKTAADDLLSQASNLKGAVNGFLKEIRAS
jgi:methyl-accepting chemotaxis protein